MAAEAVDWAKRVIVVNLTKDRIRNGLSVDTAEPVSRRHEAVFNAYYGYPAYWSGPGVWAGAAYPAQLARDVGRRIAADSALEDPEASHLRRANEVKGYHIAAADQDIGHIEDFVLDDETWVIRYLTFDTSHCLGGRQAVIAPDWIERIDWLDARLHVNVTSRDIRESPAFDPSNPNRLVEQRVQRHYDRVFERRRGESRAVSK
jgi:hypothetical protein